MDSKKSIPPIVEEHQNVSTEKIVNKDEAPEIKLNSRIFRKNISFIGNNDVQIESLFGKSQAQIQEFALQNQLIAIDVLGKNTIALHKTERITVCGIKPMVILLNFDGDACNSIQITAKTLSESDVKKLESKVKAKITVQQDELFGICNVFISFNL